VRVLGEVVSQSDDALVLAPVWVGGAVSAERLAKLLAQQVLKSDRCDALQLVGALGESLERVDGGAELRSACPCVGDMPTSETKRIVPQPRVRLGGSVQLLIKTFVLNIEGKLLGKGLFVERLWAILSSL